MQQNKLIIAIDGPGAAGKSTVAKLLAKKLKLKVNKCFSMKK